jgi:ribonuclease HI
MACAYEIEKNATPEKYISIFSDSQATLKSLQSTKTSSQLVQRRQKSLSAIFTYKSVVLFWVHGHPGIRGKDSVDMLAMEGSGRQFVDQNRLWGSRNRM